VQRHTATDPEPPSALLHSNAGASAPTRAVQRQAVAHGPLLSRQPAAASPQAPSQQEIDDAVRDSIAATLDSFRRIVVDVHGGREDPVRQQSVGIVVQVDVQAAYFINRPKARQHFAAARGVAFNAVARALRRATLLTGGGNVRTAGRAVELGKATPADVKEFVEEALRRGDVHRWAVAQRRIAPAQQLVDLPLPDLRAVIQDWIYHVGAGVDCSGFVQQAAIAARDAMRGLIAAGGPQAALPPVIANPERNARSFRAGTAVNAPADLRPGDAWVTGDLAHVRIVSAVRPAPPPAAGVDFDTAESSGSSTQSREGPVFRTWRTRSAAAFHPITPLSGGRSRGGTFHRLVQP
jgi:hypothetical protein